MGILLPVAAEKGSKYMGKQSAVLTLAGIRFDPSSKVPLHRQIYGALREVILERRVRGGMRLPSSRALAALATSVTERWPGGQVQDRSAAAIRPTSFESAAGS